MLDDDCRDVLVFRQLHEFWAMAIQARPDFCDRVRHDQFFSRGIFRQAPELGRELGLLLVTKNTRVESNSSGGRRLFVVDDDRSCRHLLGAHW